MHVHYQPIDSYLQYSLFPVLYSLLMIISNDEYRIMNAEYRISNASITHILFHPLPNLETISILVLFIRRKIYI